MVVRVAMVVRVVMVVIDSSGYYKSQQWRGHVELQYSLSWGFRVIRRRAPSINNFCTPPLLPSRLAI